MKAYLIGIDLAKETFSLHAVDVNGRMLWRKTVTRSKLPTVLANIEPCKVVRN